MHTPESSPEGIPVQPDAGSVSRRSFLSTVGGVGGGMILTGLGSLAPAFASGMGPDAGGPTCNSRGGDRSVSRAGLQQLPPIMFQRHPHQLRARPHTCLRKQLLQRRLDRTL